MNEEITMGNQENRHRAEELSQLSTDLQNLLASTQIATLFLDRDLRILRFTPQVTTLFNIGASDRGRPVTDLTHRLGYAELEQDSRRVLERLVPVEREVEDEQGHTYIGRVLPYRSGEDLILGVVVTFIDITERKQAEAALAAEKTYAESIVETLHEPLLVLTPDLRVRSANEAFYDHFDVRRGETEGELIYRLGNGQWDIPELRTLLEEVLPDSNVFNDYEVAHEFEDIGRRVMLLNARRLDHVQLILLGIRDITEKKRTEEALRERQERYRALVTSTSDVMFRMSADWTEMRELDGRNFMVDTEQPSTNWLTTYLPAEDQPHVLEIIAEAIRTKTPFELEHRVLRADGSIGWTFSRAVPLIDEQGEIVEWFGTASDVTARKEAVEALRTSEEKFRTLFESIDEGFCTFDMIFDDAGVPVDYRFVEFNPAFERHTGLTGAAGRTVRELLPEQDRHWFEIFGRVAMTGEPIRVTRYGEALQRWIEVYAFRVDDPQQRRVAALFSDVTERVRAEEALRESEERFRLFGEASSDVLWIRDAETLQWEYVSPAFDTIYGIEREAVLGNDDLRSWADLVVPEDRESALEWIHRVQTGESASFEYRIRRPNGQIRWLRDTDFPIHDENGRIRHIGGIGQDITEEKWTRQELHELNERLEERVHKQTEQIRRMARRLTLAEQDERRRVAQILHDDLQQILYGIQMKLSMLQREVDRSAGGSIFDEVTEAQQWIARAVEMTRGLTVDLSPPILKSEGLADALEWLQRQMKELHGLDVALTTEHAFIMRDEGLRVMLFQMIRELLFNVRKHAGVDKATIELTQEGDELVAVVADKGRGFDPAQNAVQEEGAGFGLRSVRERLQLIGGSFHIEAAPGKGTRITIKSPFSGPGRGS
jgi:PAS domain S-box-containing protein